VTHRWTTPPYLLVLALTGPTREKGPEPPPRTLAELESRIRAVLERTHTPAAGVALVTRDRVLWVAGLGQADVASGREATAQTLFRIGSTSKAFMALMILLLERQGKLELDDPIRKYAPEIAFTNPWEATDPVRIVHLLEHTTGWDDWAIRDYAVSDPTPLTLRQGLDFDPRSRTSRWRPGTRVAYCNSGPPVAAYIIERIEHEPFERLVHERLFAPIGMRTATFMRPDPAVPSATLYHGDGKTPYPYWHVLERPAGSINASATDMAAYVQFLLNRGAVRGRHLLPPAAIARMELPQSSLTARAGLRVGYGLHLGTYLASDGFAWVGHDGGVPGGLTLIAYRPDAGVGFAFMINSDNRAARGAIDRLIRGYLTRGATRATPPPAAPLSQFVRGRAGWYVVDNPRIQKLYFIERLVGLARVRVRDSSLTFAPLIGVAKRYVPISATLFRGTHEPIATLALVDDSADGRAATIERVGYLVPRSFHRTRAALVWLEVGATVAFLLTSVATVLFGLAWIPRRLFGGLRGAPHIWVRGWPLVAALSMVLGSVGTLVAMEDAITRLGTPTVWSVGLFLSTVVFAASSVLGGVTAVRAPRAAVRRGVRVYALVAGALNLLAVGYLAWWGVIGWRSWT
jgi:CubicO group peptidase (beta-lactamase class C family)